MDMIVRFLKWLDMWEFLVYFFLYLIYWVFNLGMFLLGGFWSYLFSVAFFVIALVRFILGIKASSGSFNSKPITLVLCIDSAILVASLGLAMIFKVEEPFLLQVELRR